MLADQQRRRVQEEERQNETLLRLSTEILKLTKEIHGKTLSGSTTGASR